MKYQQPYGVSDPEAPYINGNPSTGTMGSIPPAASIEHPQREIANFIADSRMTPTDTDLRQLAKGVQAGQVQYCDDQGTINNVAVTLAPVVTTLVKGMVIVAKIKFTNQGPSTLKVNNLAPVPIVHAATQTQIAPQDLNADSMQAFAFDGTNFQMVWSQRQPGAPIFLQAPRDFYINDATGSDSNDGQTATVGGGHGPWKTLQRAANEVPKYNLNGYAINMHVADGVYDGFGLGGVNGSGSIWWYGNELNPAACTISGVNKNAANFINCNCGIVLIGFRITASGDGGGTGLSGLVCAGGATQVNLGNMEWGSTTNGHIIAQSGGIINAMNNATWRITGGAAGGPTSGWGVFVGCSSSGMFYTNAIFNLVIPAPVTFGNSFVLGLFSGYVHFVYSSLTGAGVAGVNTQKFNSQHYSTVNCGGNSVDYLPGNQPGITGYGGVYI